jgi:O-antigen ligase
MVYATEKQMLPKILIWVLSASVAGGIICTISRKGMATGILSFSLYYYLKGKVRKIFALGVVVIILTLILSGYAIISGRFNRESLSQQFAGKWAMTYAGLQMYKESPLIGKGYKGYYDNYGRYFPWSYKTKYDAHNIFITALTNYGLLGFIPFLGILFYPLFFSKKIIRNNSIENNTGSYKDMAIICISSVIPFMINGWFAGGLFYSTPIILLLYTNIALVTNYITTVY